MNFRRLLHALVRHLVFGLLGAVVASASAVAASSSGQVTIDAARQRLEAAETAGNDSAVREALWDMMKAVVVGARSGSIPTQALTASFPETLGPLRLSAGSGVVPTRASYSGLAKPVWVSVRDLGEPSRLLGLALRWSLAPTDNATPEGKTIRRIYCQGHRLVREEFHADGRSGYAVLLGNGVVVEAETRAYADQPTLQAAVEGLDLDSLEALARTPER
jgi:hypothetical protein